MMNEIENATANKTAREKEDPQETHSRGTTHMHSCGNRGLGVLRSGDRLLPPSPLSLEEAEQHVASLPTTSERAVWRRWLKIIVLSGLLLGTIIIVAGVCGAGFLRVDSVTRGDGSSSKTGSMHHTVADAGVSDILLETDSGGRFSPGDIVNHHAVVDAINNDDGISTFTGTDGDAVATQRKLSKSSKKVKPPQVTTPPEQNELGAPLIVVPGWSTPILRVRVDGAQQRAAETTRDCFVEGIVQFSWLLPLMNPMPNVNATAIALWHRDDNIQNGRGNLSHAVHHSNLDAAQLQRGCVQEWLTLSFNASAVQHGALVRSASPAVSVDVPSFGDSFENECPRLAFLFGPTLLRSERYAADRNVYCAPMDYRYPAGVPPAEEDDAPTTSRYAERLRRLVATVRGNDQDGRKVVLGAHSFGALWLGQAVRELGAEWARDNVATVLLWGAQTTGCAECISSAFTPSWSWDPDQPYWSDRTWLGESTLATPAYGERELYRLPFENVQHTITGNYTEGFTGLELVDLLHAVGNDDAAAAASLPQFALRDGVAALNNIPIVAIYGKIRSSTIGYNLENVAATSPGAKPLRTGGDAVANLHAAMELMRVALHDPASRSSITALGGDGAIDAYMVNHTVIALPDAHVEVVPGVGHWSYWSDADSVRLTLEALDNVSRLELDVAE